MRSAPTAVVFDTFFGAAPSRQAKAAIQITMPLDHTRKSNGRLAPMATGRNMQHIMKPSHLGRVNLAQDNVGDDFGVGRGHKPGSTQTALHPASLTPAGKRNFLPTSKLVLGRPVVGERQNGLG